MRVLAGLALALAAAPLAAQDPYVAPNAPHDKVSAFSADGMSRLDSLLQPIIREARSTWPEARRRYLEGLPPRHGFFVTASLVDGRGMREVVFIGVDSIARDSIYGRVWNQIQRVQGYRLYQPYAMAEDDILDWLISKPDGSEEGNLTGKFMESYRP